MVSYNVVEKRGIKVLGDAVSGIILAREVPKPEDIATVLGDGSVDSYYFMHALMHSIEYGRRRGVVDYARRDQRAVQIHSFDSALRPFYRFKDKKLPSGYVLTPREIKGVLVHDLGEEFGQSLLGALVVNKVIGHLLREETGKDADLLTNKNALFFYSLQY